MRRRRNHITGLHLLNDGAWCTNDESLKKEALDYFHSLFCHKDLDPLYLPSRNMPRLSNSASDCLLAPMLQDEVQKTLNSMKSFKAPRPDGFQAFFFRKYWNVVGHDLWCLVSDAFRNGFFDSHFSGILIALIPKM